MKNRTDRFRILLIEDNVDRVNLFKQWLCEEGLLTVASSVGKAMGMLLRDKGRVYSGILLDHDLQEQVITDSDLYLSSTNLVDLIIENIEKDVPILMHSMNSVQTVPMKKKLESAGFEVTQNPMADFTKLSFNEWQSLCYELWMDSLECE